MARVRTSRFAARQGATLACEKCRNQIGKGESYRWFKVGFRSRYKHIRCNRPECTPRQSEMTASKMAGVYAAIEDAESALSGLAPGEVSDIESILQTAGEGIEEVADEYREAGEASPTGLVFGEDLNERADEISDAANELQSWSPSEDEPDYDSCDEDHHDEDPEDPEQEIIDRGAGNGCDACDDIQVTWWDQVLDEARDALGNVQV